MYCISFTGLSPASSDPNAVTDYSVPAFSVLSSIFYIISDSDNLVDWHFCQLQIYQFVIILLPETLDNNIRI